jgi:hypothetical protein
MSVQLEIPFETLTDLVEQLPIDEQQRLLERLHAKVQHLSNSALDDPAEKIRRLRAAVSSAELIGDFPIRREDMYGDDGR